MQSFGIIDRLFSICRRRNGNFPLQFIFRSFRSYVVKSPLECGFLGPDQRGEKKLQLFFITPNMGEKLQELRKERGVKIFDVEAETGIGHSTLYEIEKGSKRVKPTTIQTLCDY